MSIPLPDKSGSTLDTFSMDKIVFGKNILSEGKDIIIRLDWDEKSKRYVGYDPYDGESISFNCVDLFEINKGKCDSKTFVWSVL